MPSPIYSPPPSYSYQPSKSPSISPESSISSSTYSGSSRVTPNEGTSFNHNRAAISQYGTAASQAYYPTDDKRSSGYRWVVFALFALSVVVTLILLLASPPADPMDPAVRERIRAGWERELRRHEDDRRRYAAERQEWDEQRARERQAWAREVEEHERKQAEEREREEEERRRLNLVWTDVKPSPRCLSYGTLEYTAHLTNIPRGYDGMKACKSTSIEIHGVTLETPNKCEDLGFWGGVVGHFNFYEPSCASYWDNFKDKGCYPTRGSGIHLYESHLANLRDGSDWETMCSTTPVSFNHMHFASPTHCANWGKHGYWGIWEVEDNNC